ncbi:MAG: SDR family NAD(P)-dependent oxidoreductase, partial [Gemmataceae bacterium]
MDLGLGKKIVIVTGGAGGIGAAVVRALAAEGAVPAVVDRDPGGDDADLSEPGACRHAVAEVLRRFGRIDALINNAGV